MHPIPNSIYIPRAGPVLTQMPGFDEDEGCREHASTGGRERHDQAFHCQLEDFMRLESEPVSPASSRVALLGKDAIWSGGMLAKVSKGGRAVRASLGQDEVL